MFYVQAFQRFDLVSSAPDDLFDSAIHLPLDEFYVHVEDLNCYYNHNMYPEMKIVDGDTKNCIRYLFLYLDDRGCSWQVIYS